MRTLRLDAERQRTHRGVVALSVVLPIAVVGQIGFMVVHGLRGVLPSLVSVLALLPWFILMRWGKRYPVTGIGRFDRVPVTIDERGITIGEERFAAPGELRRAEATTLEDGRKRVTLERHGARVVLLLGEADADALLRAVGFPGGSALSLPSFRPQGNFILYAMLFPLLAMLGCSALAGIDWMIREPRLCAYVALGYFLAVMGAALVASRITIASDGVRIRRYFSRTFVSFAELDSLERLDDGLVLVTKDGRRVRVLDPRGRFQRIGKYPTAETDRFVAQIEMAWQRHQTSERLRMSAASLEPGDRSTAEWLDAVAALGAGASSYREPALPVDVLYDVLESPAASGKARLGAAVALRGSGDVAAEPRIRVAATMTADPELREDLETVLDVPHEHRAQLQQRLRMR